MTGLPQYIGPSRIDLLIAIEKYNTFSRHEPIQSHYHMTPRELYQIREQLAKELAERLRSRPDNKPRVESQKKLLQLSVRKSTQVVSTSQKPESVKIPSKTFSSGIVNTHKVKPPVKLTNRTTTQDDTREAQAAHDWNLATRESNEAEARYLVSLDKKDYKAWEVLRHRRIKKAKALADIRQMLRKGAQKKLEVEKKAVEEREKRSRCG